MPTSWKLSTERSNCEIITTLILVLGYGVSLPWLSLQLYI